MPQFVLSLTPLTELEAVNAILATISEAPVNTLVGSLTVDTAMARNMLHGHSRKLQMRGWSFNRDTGYQLYPNTSGEVTIPTNSLVTTFPEDASYVCRGSKVYDRDTFSFLLGRDSVAANIIWFMPFSELPEHARNLIYLQAGKQFQDQTFGDGTLHQITAKDVEDATQSFSDAEDLLEPKNATTGLSSIRRLRNRRIIR